MINEKEDGSHPKFWYGRGFLPHFDGGQIIQFITFRLADSLPQIVLDGYKLQLEQDLISDIEYHRKIDKYLDKGLGNNFLKDARIGNCSWN